MRLFIIAAAVAGAALIANGPSFAAGYPPWCLKASMGRAMVDLCYFQTFERCAQERFNYGNTSFCIVNPEYYFRYGEPDQRPRKVRRNVKH